MTPNCLARARVGLPTMKRSEQSSNVCRRAHTTTATRATARTLAHSVSLSATMPVKTPMHATIRAKQPHPLDSGGAVLVGYVDPITRWQDVQVQRQLRAAGESSRRALRPGRRGCTTRTMEDCRAGRR
eukprot:1587331-Pleurochrysis_carterae.AAC.2